MIVKVCKLDEIEVAGKKVKVGVDTIEPKLPEYGKEGDACMDIYPIYWEYDKERDRWIYHTGLAFAIGGTEKIPNEMEIRPRSNLTKSDFYMPNSPATLDFGYRGELLIIFKNRTSIGIRDSISFLTTAIEKLSMRVGAHGEIKQYTSSVRKHINKLSHSITEPPYKCDGNDRCCQLLIRGTERIEWDEVKSVEELGSSERGNGGFGSTGGAVK